jgi:hypothetical protein
MSASGAIDRATLLWQQAWGEYIEVTADERSARSHLELGEGSGRRAITDGERDHARRVEGILQLEASTRFHLTQVEGSERVTVLGVPFIVGREMVVALNATQTGRSAQSGSGGASAGDVLVRLQEELAQLRHAAEEDRSRQAAQDQERSTAWRAQSTSVAQVMHQLEDRVRQALDGYQRESRVSVAEAAARAAERAMERLQESQLLAKDGNDVSDEARRLAKMEFSKLRIDARDTALRHTIREERDARDFLEEMQFLVRREVLHLFHVAILRPLHTVEGAASPQVEMEDSKTPARLASVRATVTPSLTESLRQEANNIQRGRRFLQYFHVIGYDTDTAVLYCERFLEHGFGFAVDLTVSEAEAVIGIHEVCRDVTQQELGAMGITSVGERRTLFARMKRFEEPQPLMRSPSSADDVRSTSMRDPSQVVDPSAFVSPLHHPRGADVPPSPSPRRLDAGNDSDRCAHDGLTPSTVQAFRERCLVRLGQLDRQLSDAWTLARHAARRKRSYTYEEEAEWESAYGTAQANDATRVSIWLGELSELEVACKVGAVLAPEDLPIPFDRKSGPSRALLLDMRSSGRPCPRLWHRSVSANSRETSQACGTTPAFPSWW